jgi:hypothetical protein
MEISTRCGQDSDCNPSNAMAVLGVIRGFSGLPSEWQEAIAAIGDSLFIHTDYSFRKAVDNSLNYALQLATAHGGRHTGDSLSILIQQPEPLPFETSFPNLVFDQNIPVSETGRWKVSGNWEPVGNTTTGAAEPPKVEALSSAQAGDTLALTFEGTGISLVGHWLKDGGKADIFVDEVFKRTIDCYFNYAGQQHHNMNLFHITGLAEGPHTLEVVVRGEKRPESEGTRVYITEAVVFKTGEKTSDKTRFTFHEHN